MESNIKKKFGSIEMIKKMVNEKITIPEISNEEIKIASIERFKLRSEDSNIEIAAADSLGFFIGAEWYREQLKNK